MAGDENAEMLNYATARIGKSAKYIYGKRECRLSHALSTVYGQKNDERGELIEIYETSRFLGKSESFCTDRTVMKVLEGGE